jgi:aminoglycoside 3-N-acetyltransferase
VIGPSGTLLFPTHSWHLMNAGNRRFDVRNTPSGVGVLTEVFRQLPGVIRSHHPTHSVAVSGQNSDWFTEGHLTATTPCGAGTPYEKLCQAEGQILFLGTTLRSNTTFHTAEALAEAPYLMESSAEEFEIVGEDGAIKSCRVRMHAQRIGRRFDSLIEPLEETGILRKGPVGQSASLLVDAGPMVAWTVSRLRENPSFLLRSSH